MLLKAKSRLNATIMDCLHEAGIEIPSPHFMNQRQVGDTVFIPEKVKKIDAIPPLGSPEDKVFDIADEAQSIEERKANLKEIDEKVNALKDELHTASDIPERDKIDAKISRWKEIKKRLQDKI